MADMPERIYANDANHWHPFPGEEGTAEYVRADIYAKELSRLAIESKDRELALAELEAEVIAIRDRVQFLEKALDQAISATALTILTPREYEDDAGRVHDLPEGLACAHLHLRGIDDYPELAQYLKEKTEG